MTTPDRREDKWHIGKEIPISVIGVFIFQIILFTYGAATFSAELKGENKILRLKIEELSYQVAALTIDKYTQNDAKRDQALILQRMSSTESRVEKLEYQTFKWRK